MFTSPKLSFRIRLGGRGRRGGDNNTDILHIKSIQYEGYLQS